jgi:hypothetical protein
MIIVARVAENCYLLPAAVAVRQKVPLSWEPFKFIIEKESYVTNKANVSGELGKCKKNL